MERYRCLTHNVTLIIDAKKRTIQNPIGAYAGMPQCQLHLVLEPKEGKTGECQIERVS